MWAAGVVNKGTTKGAGMAVLVQRIVRLQLWGRRGKWRWNDSGGGGDGLGEVAEEVLVERLLCAARRSIRCSEGESSRLTESVR